MRGFSAVFKMQARRMLTRKRFGLLFLAMSLLVTTSYLETCVAASDGDVRCIYSAATGWIGRINAFGGFNIGKWTPSIMKMFFNFFLILFGALAFSDFYDTDQRAGIYPALITRCSSNAYHVSGAILCFLGAFAVIAAPLLISQGLMFFLFPAQTVVNERLATINPLWKQMWGEGVLFPSLFFNHPYLTNLLYIFYDGLMAGTWALVSYVLSLFVRKARFLFLILPVVLLAAVSYTAGCFGLFFLIYDHYLYPGSGFVKYPAVFAAYVLVPLAACILILFRRLRKKGADEL